MKLLVQRWIIITLAVLVAANLVKGIHYDTVAGLLVASLLLGVLNSVLRPVMFLLSLPLVVLTLGLFVLVINALLLYLVGRLVKTFHVDSFSAAFWGSLVISLVSMVVNALAGTGDSRIRVRHRRTGGDSANGSRGSGPVIDI